MCSACKCPCTLAARRAACGWADQGLGLKSAGPARDIHCAQAPSRCFTSLHSACQLILFHTAPYPNCKYLEPKTHMRCGDRAPAARRPARCSLRRSILLPHCVPGVPGLARVRERVPPACRAACRHHRRRRRAKHAVEQAVGGGRLCGRRTTACRASPLCALRRY